MLKSPYVKQRSFLDGTEVYCIDVPYLTVTDFSIHPDIPPSPFPLVSTISTLLMCQWQFFMGPDIRSSPREN